MLISIKKAMKLNEDHNFDNIVMVGDNYFEKQGKNNDI